MEGQATGDGFEDDVRRSGYLRKHKSMHRRYFVLRAASERGPARLEYYESEKKFRGKAPVPKRAVALETCFNINKRADAKNKHMIVLYTRAESFAVAAESEAEQDDWYQALVELQCRSEWGLGEWGGYVRATHTSMMMHACYALAGGERQCAGLLHARRNVAASFIRARARAHAHRTVFKKCLFSVII